MGAPLFAFRNFVDLSGTTLSGGDWSTGLPLANIQDRRLAKVARSVTDATADTQFDIDLGANRLCRVFSLHNHNLSLAATVRLRGYTGAGHTGNVYDSGAIVLHDDIYPASVLQTGHASYSSLDLESEMWGEDYKVDWTVVFGEQSARYWWVTIDDTANVDTYVQVGRVWLSYGYKADHAISTGARLAWESDSKRTVTDGGSAIYDEEPRRRQYDFTVRSISDDEALVYAMELERYCGTTKQMLFVGDVDDTAHMHRRSFPATIRRPGPVEFARALYANKTYSLVEEL